MHVVVGEEAYYAPFTVVSKHITDHQLEMMKEELEKAIRGLTFDFIRRHLSQGNPLFATIPPKIFQQFMIIQKHFSSVMAALSDLYTKVNFRVQKVCETQFQEQVKEIDAITIRRRLQHPDRQLKLKVPIRSFDYNLTENQWVKRIVKSVLAFLQTFHGSAVQYMHNIQQQIESQKRFDFQESTRRVLIEMESVIKLIQEYVGMVEKMKGAFQMILSAPWYPEVSEQSYSAIPHVLTNDSRYRALYQLYREMQVEEPQISLNEDFFFQWKRTDKLYEMWGYVTFVQTLQRALGFQPIDGWIYDQPIQEDRYLIPVLPEGTMIVLKRDQLEAHVIYDGVTPLTSRKTDKYHHPLYTSDTHNRPDTRIDYYQEGVYIGTLMVDFKYRYYKTFWDATLVNTIARTDDMRQLTAYGRHFITDSLYGEDSLFRGYNPVEEAWAVYPQKMEGEGFANKMWFEDQKVRLMALSPGYENAHLAERLETNYPRHKPGIVCCSISFYIIRQWGLRELKFNNPMRCLNIIGYSISSFEPI
jgi:hypothetical protein